ncbi:hypothetical protein ACRU43_16205 [Mycobacterium colombiense]
MGHPAGQGRTGATTEKARWTAEDELVKMGVEFSRGEMWKPYMLNDRNFFTGQNPASAGPFAREFMKELG